MQSLDRFSVGLMDREQAREVGECEHCCCQMFEGNEALKYDGNLYCDEFCLKEYLLESVVYEEITA